MLCWALLPPWCPWGAAVAGLISPELSKREVQSAGLIFPLALQKAFLWKLTFSAQELLLSTKGD